MKAEKGKICVVPSIPNCDFCNQEGTPTPGPYDFKTRMGPWAHGCEAHYELYQAAVGLGVGKAQLWITKEQLDPSPKEQRIMDFNEAQKP